MAALRTPLLSSKYKDKTKAQLIAEEKSIRDKIATESNLQRPEDQNHWLELNICFLEYILGLLRLIESGRQFQSTDAAREKPQTRENVSRDFEPLIERLAAADFIEEKLFNQITQAIGCFDKQKLGTIEDLEVVVKAIPYVRDLAKINSVRELNQQILHVDQELSALKTWHTDLDLLRQTQPVATTQCGWFSNCLPATKGKEKPSVAAEEVQTHSPRLTTSPLADS